MVTLTQGHERNMASERLTSLVGLQKPLYEGIEVEEKKLWKDCTDFNIHVTEAVVSFLPNTILSSRSTNWGSFFTSDFFNKYSCPKTI